MPLPLPVAPLLVREELNPPVQGGSGRLWGLLTALAVGAGALLRLFHWLDNRALWRDELYLAVSLVRRGFWELATRPLAYEQKAPLGFLWAERLAVAVLGKGEMALRLFPLLCGLAALAAFAPVARHFLRPWAAALAVALLALASPAVYHSVEAKQYSAELLASVLGLLLYVRLPARPGWGRLLGWGLAGAALLWFSYSAVFVLAGVGAAAGLGALRRGGVREALPYALPAALWLASFAAVYALFLGRYQDSQWLTVFFQKVYSAYMPLVPTSAEDFTWFLHKANALIKHPLGQKMRFTGALSILFVQLRLVSLLLLGMGLVLMPRKNFQKYMVLILPVVMTLIASGLQLYPFHERFLLFLAPMFLLLMGYGAQVLQEVLPKKLPVKLLISVLLLAAPVWNAIGEAWNTDSFYKKEANREALLYINELFKEGDVVYVYWNMWHAYAYYKEAYDLKFTAVEGKDLKTTSADYQEYLNNLASGFHQFHGQKRLWFLFHTHVRNNIGGFVGQPAWYFDKAFVPGQTLEATFSKMGEKQKERFEEKETVVSLFRLNP